MERRRAAAVRAADGTVHRRLRPRPRRPGRHPGPASRQHRRRDPERHERMTATAIRPADSPSDGALSHRQILTILSGLVLGMFLAALDQTIVSTAIKTIGNDLHDLQAQAWVTTAFLITSTIAAPLFGKLSDIYGRKRLFMFAIVIFVAGLRAVRPGHLDVRAGRLPRLPGHRRGRHHAAGAGRHRRHHPAPRARPLPGLHDGGLRQRLGARAGARRPAGRDERLPRRRRVAVDLLHQRARSPPWRCSSSPGCSSSTTVRRERRIDWWGALALAVGLVPLLVVAEEGQQLGLGLGRLVHLLLARRRRPGRVRLDPAPDGR